MQTAQQRFYSESALGPRFYSGVSGTAILLWRQRNSDSTRERVIYRWDRRPIMIGEFRQGTGVTAGPGQAKACDCGDLTTIESESETLSPSRNDIVSTRLEPGASIYKFPKSLNGIKRHATAQTRITCPPTPPFQCALRKGVSVKAPPTGKARYAPGVSERMQYRTGSHGRDCSQTQTPGIFNRHILTKSGFGRHEV